MYVYGGFTLYIGNEVLFVLFAIVFVLDKVHFYSDY